METVIKRIKFSEYYKAASKNKDIMDGPSLRGYIAITYDELVDKFGKPERNVGDKVLAAFHVFINGVPVEFYIYKETRIPKGKHSWHIGGPVASGVIMAVEHVFPHHGVASMGRL